MTFDKVTEKAVTILAFTLGAFHLLNVSGILLLSTRDVRIFHLFVMLALLFLTRPTLKRLESSAVDRMLRVTLVGISLASGVFMMSRWEEIAMSGGLTDSLDIWIGVVVLLLVLEAARRGVGVFLAGICVVFFSYPFYSAYLPGVLSGRGYSLERMSEFLTTTSQGVFGLPLGVSSTYIVLFAIYGAFLSEFGAGDFFFRLARRLTKGMRAAGAKTAVIFSTLLGMISGSAAGNVAVTGTLTIPMMKREGYKAHQAGAIEAVVSTGGQIMPPVMGASAFIMAEIIGTPYANIMRAAIIPAMLFFASLFFVVHLQATKSRLEPQAEPADDDEPTWMILVNGGQYIIPFTALIAMMVNGYSPFKASFASICILIVTRVLWTRRVSSELFVKSARAITEGTKSVIPIAVACAAAGIIAGTLGITGLGSKISGLIVYSSGEVAIVALFLTMLTAIVLGMGLPTTAAYLVLATVVAPALSKLGVPILTAHMFVFFYGCLSTITPPVALASYVAAGIAKTDVNKVGWTAFGFGITSYVIPFMFFFGPALLLDGPPEAIVPAVITGIAGTYCIASMVVGHAVRPLALWQRIVMGIAGLALLHQGLITDLGGAGLILVLYVSSRVAGARKAGPI